MFESFLVLEAIVEDKDLLFIIFHFSLLWCPFINPNLSKKLLLIEKSRNILPQNI